MVLFPLFFFLSLAIFAGIGSSQDDQCMASKCSDRGPAIRFPFRLKDQPSHSVPGSPVYAILTSADLDEKIGTGVISDKE